MLEVITEAVVLDKEDLGEQDSRVFLYTKDLGKIAAKATSARKITSKLAGHLQPFNLITARLISKQNFFDGKGFQLADALSIDNSKNLKSDPELLSEAIKTFDLIRRSIPEGVPDRELWEFLGGILNKEAPAHLSNALQILGFDSAYAVCELCDNSKPGYFFPKNNFFVCQSCRAVSNEIKNNFIKLL